MEIILKDTKELNYDIVTDIFFDIKFLRYPEKREVYKRAIEKAFRNSQLVVSAWNGDMLIGFARILTDGSLFATVWNMIVKPSYQKRGVGKKLLQKCIDAYPTCHFFLFSGENSASFYKKSEFEIHQFGMYLKDGKKRCVIYM